MGRDIKKCHPELQEKAMLLIEECRKAGLIIELGECMRTIAEQDKLYAQGRTAPGEIVTYARGRNYSSMHQWGVAFDIIRNDGKGAYNDSNGWFKKVGAIGIKIGLEWGGDWISPVDKPHFQLPYWGSTPAKLKKLYTTPTNFKKTWKEYKTYAVKEGDDEVVSEGKAIVNGKEYEIDRILKNDENYIRAVNFGNMGFDVDYNAKTKAVTLDNKTKDIKINADGNEYSIRALNLNGYNYVSLADIAEVFGKKAEEVNGEIVIK